MAQARSRARRLNVTQKQKDVDPELQKKLRKLAINVFTHNKAMNAEKSKHDKNRKELLKLMQDNHIEVLDPITFTYQDTKKTIETGIVTPETSYIDVNKLKELVDEKTFMMIVSATATAVKDHAGELVATQCKKFTKGKTNVVVKA